MISRRTILATVACALLGCASSKVSRPDLTPIPKEAGGHLLLIGGGEKPTPIVDLFIRLAGGPEASIIVLPLASEDSREAGADYVKLFGSRGASKVRVIQIDDRRDSLRAEYADAIRGAGGVFIGGGDQKRIVDRILDTPIYDALVAMRAGGGVIAGTSAGTACQSDPMLTGYGAEDVIRAGNVVTSRGLGFLEGVIIDQHFVARQRQNRLLSVVLEHPEQLGVGVDEGTAIWVRPDRTLEVLGLGWVEIYDPGQARVNRDEEGRLSAKGVTFHVLTAGQRYHLATRTVLE